MPLGSCVTAEMIQDGVTMIEATEMFPVYSVELGDIIKTKYGNVIVEDIDDYTYDNATVIKGPSELDIECKVVFKNEDTVELVFMMEEEVE
jgi:hypothetical protein